jgi:regulator of protease activity HflC (stomatin/prohibitin superfamily)
MWLFIFGLIFLVATAVAVVGQRATRAAWKKYDNRDVEREDRWGRTPAPDMPRRVYAQVAAGLGFFAVLFLVLSMVTIVSATQVGVPVTLGRAGHAMQSGLHFKSPITKVHKLPTRGVPVKLSTDKDADSDPVVVRTSQGGQFTVSISTRWATDKVRANKLFLQAHTSEDKISTGIIETDLKQAVNAVYATLTNVDAANKRGQIADDVSTHLAGLVATYGIDVSQTQLLSAEPDAGTRAALSSFAQEQNRTIVAGQAALTATANAKARLAEATGIKAAADASKLTGDELASACLQQWSNVVGSAAAHGVAVYTNPCSTSAVTSIIANGK